MNQLRTSPRQRRSQESVGAILDAAEALIHEQGQISFTAGELAERADMSVGRVYYWFPDIPAVVGALAERLRTQLSDRLGALRLFAFDAPTTEVAGALVDALCDHVDQHPATLPVCFVAGSIDYGEALRCEVVAMLRTIATQRLVDPTDDELDVIAATVGGMLLGVTRQYAASPSTLRPGIRVELANVIVAWVGARFPQPDDPVWQQSDAPVRPKRAHRHTRAPLGAHA